MAGDATLNLKSTSSVDNHNREPQPAILPLIAANLPREDLAPFPHHVTWDLEWRNGEDGKPGGWTKVPKNPRTGANASSDKPKTWGDADDVLDFHGRYGYMVAEDDPFTFLDVDNGIDRTTGAIKPWAQAIVDRFPAAYWERSTTGTGLKGLIRGRSIEVREDGRTRNRIIRIEDGKIEIFYWGKFTALTGHRLTGSSATIGDGQAALEALIAELRPNPAPQPMTPAPELRLDDQTIIERVRRMDRGRQLFDAGDYSAYGNDHSAADLALLNCLRSCGVSDAAQFDRIFRASALMRPKWERNDYRDGTIARALDGTVVPFEGWDQPASATIVRVTGQPKIGTNTGKPQDAGTGIGDDSTSDDCADVRDELAALRAEKPALLQQLAERDAQIGATRRRADKAEAELTNLRLLQSATMTMLRSREMRPGEKVLGLVALFEAEAAQQRGTTDLDGWSDVPLGRLADAGGCSPDTAGKHLSTISTTGIVETRTISRRDPNTGEIRKHRQIRLPSSSDSAAASDLVGRITLLSSAIPERDPSDLGWGGKRVCPDCGDVGTITITTIACAGCGSVLSTTKRAQGPESSEAQSPNRQDAASKYGCGSTVSPNRQDAGTEKEERRDWSRQDLLERACANDLPIAPRLPGLGPAPLDPLTDVARGARHA